MFRVPFLGLRGRLTAALLAVSALTFAAVAGALLLPLNHRLRQDALTSLSETALAARPSFADLPADAIRPRSRGLARAAERLRRQTGVEVAATDERGRLLAATDVEPGERFDRARRALRVNRPVRGLSGSGDDQVGEVAIPVRADDKRFAITLRRPLDAARSAEQVVRGGLLLAAPAGLALALVAGVLLAGRLVRRLNALRDTALRVADVGPVAEVQPDGAQDEVGDLTRAFATMQQRLREQEQARRTFVATASHELRTPVASLRLVLESVASDLDPSAPDLAAARDGVDRAQSQSIRLGRLAAELLDLSRLDAGLPLREELVDLRDLSRSVVSEFEVRGRERDVVIELDARERNWAVVDPGGVARVLSILLDNALRFGPRGSVVTVRVAARDSAPVVTVSDAGPGVPAEEREHIFERFHRGNETAGESGFGLGLAIGRELAGRMGGALRLTDVQDGATFELSLPPAPPDLVHPEAA